MLGAVAHICVNIVHPSVVPNTKEVTRGIEAKVYTFVQKLCIIPYAVAIVTCFNGNGVNKIFRIFHVAVNVKNTLAILRMHDIVASYIDRLVYKSIAAELFG